MRARYTEFGLRSLDLGPSTACKVSCSATSGSDPPHRIHFDVSSLRKVRTTTLLKDGFPRHLLRCMAEKG